jgi:biopolymer transport protein ExbD
MIDVVFLLLVFFMLVSSFVDLRAIGLATPEVTGDGAGMEGSVLVRILSDGQLDLNGSVVAEPALQTRVRALLAGDPDRAVLLQPAPSVPLQSLVEVIDLLGAAGARDLAVMR